ncbi:hypothetical protein KC343_g8928 [Hortaea werneckii]|uniref:Uncharacterized protein n=1 Tax=Hortaea werneckii TaxID=91943 RepID=A0A3M7G7J1_HORWE|nr:hypothetical protein KC352_g16072 [Hortaea werneckii]KAI7568840.1 hypothetical protein KC317_g3830 [Hortaea werneckii]KAI7618887.1 hypothetical protein KC343_g8928 [Hortaea werneckii]KAI7621870.1 hypothetical protein KC346_g3468 [Hortaea werneckii]KAI7678744.1 hypothetical protein KC319_g3148 [Hortaea werneckii]
MPGPRRSGRSTQGSAPEKFDHTRFPGYSEFSPSAPLLAASASCSPFGRNMKKNGGAGPAEPLTEMSSPIWARQLVIYDWPVPCPKDFTKLKDYQRRWKEARDNAFASKDKSTPFDFDDWQTFAGNPDHYVQWNNFLSAVASAFVVRSKRAFVAGVSWKDFVDQELQEDSEDTARKQTLQQPQRKTTIMSEALKNKTRLIVFSHIAVRLCNEIWLEKCVSVPKIDAVLNEKRVPQINEKRDSKMVDNDIDALSADGGSAGAEEQGRRIPARGKDPVYGWPVVGGIDAKGRRMATTAVEEFALRPLDMDTSSDDDDDETDS